MHQRSLPITSFCALFALLTFLPARPTSAAKPREGDILRVFTGQRVYVITNSEADAPQLADALLAGCPVKERRVLTLKEWNALPRETRWYVTCVYLLDRERIPADMQVPATCRPEDTETWTEVMRTGRDWGVAYDITLSAPDLANLRRAIASFRRLKEAPKQGALTQNVRSLAVTPVGDGAARAVLPYLNDSDPENEPPHLLPSSDYAARQGRIGSMDEVILVDRATANRSDLPPSAAPVADELMAPRSEVIAWREVKPGGYVRTYVSAPSAATLTGVLKKSPENLLALGSFTKPTVLANARDLRPVRRIAVATVGGPRISDETAHRLAGYAASQLRSLDAFEVLERNALNAVLAEVALDQAGLTKANNRARVRQLAAADALLIVDLSRCDGDTQYRASNVRVTPRWPGPPRRPAEPTRLKTNISFEGKNGDAVRTIAESLLGGVVGKKTDEEYNSDMREYRRRTLPAWERDIYDYNDRAAHRRVEWRQTITAKSSVHVGGSLRLVDLTDGMVLWETPLTGSDQFDRTDQTRTVTTIGEDSAEPGADDLPGANGDLPDELLSRAAEASLGEAITALQSTALLPTNDLLTDPITGTDKPGEKTVSGRVIDVDGTSVLIGLGAADGLAVGSTLNITLSTGAKIGVTVARVRPRTCDANFTTASNPIQRSRVKIGDIVTKVVPTQP